MNTPKLMSLVAGTALLVGAVTGCGQNSDDDAATHGAPASGGSSGTGGMTAAGGSSGKGGTATGGTGGSSAGGEAGATTGSGGESGSATTGGTGGGSGGSAGGGKAGGAGGGQSGTGGSGSPALDTLCAAYVKLKQDKVQELGCSGDDSEASGRLCAVSGSCLTELEADYDCAKNATTWSCDTGDGHPQTNASCKDTSAAFFACLGPAVHEEDPFGCAAIAAMHNDIAMSLGCNADTMVENICNQLYLRNLCIEPWEALAGCLDSATESDFECDQDDNLQPTICSSERNAYDDCLANLG